MSLHVIRHGILEYGFLLLHLFPYFLVHFAYLFVVDCRLN